MFHADFESFVGFLRPIFISSFPGGILSTVYLYSLNGKEKNISIAVNNPQITKQHR